MKKVLVHCKIVLTIMLFAGNLSAQSMLDFSVGTSRQDNFFANIAYRRQVSDKFRIGFESQFGSPTYRFIDAKLIKKGSVVSFAVPLTLRMYEKDKIRLDFYTKVGARFISTDEVDLGNKLGGDRSSTAMIFEPGLLVTVNLNEELTLQSGLTVPTVFQASPSTMLENVFPLLAHFSLNKQLSSSKSIFIKTAFGPATGGDGDTQKFATSIQAGIRLNLGNKGNKSTPSFVEPSF
jgi:hypothetical protein